MTAIRVEHLSKQYRLGMIGGATLREDLSRWWALKRGRPDPLAKVGHGDGGSPSIGERFWALKDVSFEVKQGEALGIIGRNGAGKSTLLKILSRITAPTEGVVKIKGRIGSLLEVGTGFHPELTGRENIYLNGAILGMNRREVTKKLDEIVAFSGVEQFIDTPVKRYSSGMYVRLAFAVAAHLDPEILIVDEVLAVGDAAFQKKCLGKMGDVAHEGRTVLFVSHNMTAVRTLCDEAILLNAGAMVTRGTTHEVVEAYLGGGCDNMGSADLSTHPGRTPASSPWLRWVELEDRTGRQTSVFPVGEDICVRLRVAPTERLAHPAVGIGVSTLSDERVFTVHTEFDDAELPALSGAAEIRCVMRGVRLLPGTYTIKIAVGDGGRDRDTINDAVRFDVVGTGWTGKAHARGTARQGLVCQEAHWSAVEAGRDEERGEE